MLIDDQKQALTRALVGGALGMAAFLLLAWLTQPGAFFGVKLSFDFTFCYNSRVPETLGAALGFLLWFLFGAEIGIATLPFALLLRLLSHGGFEPRLVWMALAFSLTGNLLGAGMRAQRKKGL